jgi:hypothetical protein
MRTILKFLILATFFAFFSCEKDVSEPDTTKGFTENFLNIMTPDKINELKKAGVPINEGIDPPALDGVFRGKLKVINSSENSRIGINLSYDLYHQFSKFEPKSKTCLIEWRELNNGKVRTFGGGGGEYVMSGSNNKFTIIGYEDFINIDDEITFYLTSYSGEITSNGIKDFMWGRFLLDDKLNVIPDAFEIYVSQSGTFIKTTKEEGQFK